MIIDLVRSGGFIGNIVSKTIDTDNLPDTVADKIEGVASRFNGVKHSTKPDMFGYNVSVTSNGKKKEFVVSDDDVANDKDLQLLFKTVGLK